MACAFCCAVALGIMAQAQFGFLSVNSQSHLLLDWWSLFKDMRSVLSLVQAAQRPAGCQSKNFWMGSEAKWLTRIATVLFCILTRSVKIAVLYNKSKVYIPPLSPVGSVTRTLRPSFAD